MFTKLYFSSIDDIKNSLRDLATFEPFDQNRTSVKFSHKTNISFCKSSFECDRCRAIFDEIEKYY